MNIPTPTQTSEANQWCVKFPIAMRVRGNYGPSPFILRELCPEAGRIESGMLIGKVSLLYHKDFGKYVLAFENAMSCFVLFIY